MTASADPAVLLTALRAGEPAAREAIVRGQGGGLLVMAQQLLADRNLAVAAVRAGLATAFAGCERAPADVTAWLRHQVVAAALPLLRCDPVQDDFAIGAQLPAFLPDGHRRIDAEPGPTQVQHWLAGGAGRQRLQACIERLPASYRVVLVLRDVEGLDEPTTAALVGCPRRELRARHRKARLALRELVHRAAAVPAATA